MSLIRLSLIKRLIEMDSSIIQDKFHGCLLGALIGDCLGAPYEGEIMTNKSKCSVKNFFKHLHNSSGKRMKMVTIMINSAGFPLIDDMFLQYTDDTAMTISVAKFLFKGSSNLDYKQLAKLFVNEYRNQPSRGYGANVVTVFHKLDDQSYENVFQPATEQFNGQGSLGNGGAMRIAPVPLYFHDDYDKMINVAREVTRTTHSHLLAIHGTFVQCMAIQQAFYLNKDKDVDFCEFCDNISKKIEIIEKKAGVETSYKNKLDLVKHYLKASISKTDKVSTNHIINNLGNSICAYDSVCTAIYCFLLALNPIDIKIDNIFQRTIQYAITLGGDTDTIASMAGAIAGAYLGETGINKHLIKHCESHQYIIKLADKLYNAKCKLN